MILQYQEYYSALEPWSWQTFKP